MGSLRLLLPALVPAPGATCCSCPDVWFRWRVVQVERRPSGDSREEEDIIDDADNNLVNLLGDIDADVDQGPRVRFDLPYGPEEDEERAARRKRPPTPRPKAKDVPEEDMYADEPEPEPVPVQVVCSKLMTLFVLGGVALGVGVCEDECMLVCTCVCLSSMYANEPDTVPVSRVRAAGSTNIPPCVSHEVNWTARVACPSHAQSEVSVFASPVRGLCE